KPLGEKDAHARFTIVDGRLFEIPKQDAKSGAGGREGRAGRRRARPEPEFYGHLEDHDCGNEHGTALTYQSPEPPEDDEEPEESETVQSEPTRDEKAADDESDGAEEKKKKREKEIPPGPLDPYLGHEPKWSIENEEMRIPSFRTGGDLLLRNATVLTIADGTLENASILIRDGKIAAVGDNIAVPDDVTAVDLSGYFVSPAILDPHSHIAIDGTNEWSLSVTPEVRIDDVINSRTRRIYDALTGGCTTIHAMHGSANVIGGQCRMLKLKNGTSAADMRLANAPKTVKFATGENVKQEDDRNTLNRDDNVAVTRFPKSRMGVEVVMRRALTAGRDYHEKWAAYERARKNGKNVEPVRRDLRLEALGDIVAGDIWINMHCYRADEVLRELQVAEDFGVRMGALHHILEGYRIMPEIARHGAGTATFSDWWAYKVEAYDAVPQNAGLLQKAGVNSAIKSDSADLMRHLNLEAAKCMQFSNLTSTEAMKLITINAAKMFGLDDRLGSIEVGKDGDLAIFDGHPLDTFAKCVMTTIEGEVYFVHPDFDPKLPSEKTRPPMTFFQDQLNDVFGNDGWHNDGSGRFPKEAELLTALDARGGREAESAFAIVGATIHPVSGPAIESGTLVIRDGKIESLGATTPDLDGIRVIEAAGLHVYPGMINAATTVGLHEIDSTAVTVDESEIGRFQPDIHAATAINSHSRMIDIARQVGILSAAVVPSGPFVAGQVGLVHLHGWTMPEMLVDNELALVVSLPSRQPEPLADNRPERFKERMEERNKRVGQQQQEIRDFFENASRYAEMRAAGDKPHALHTRYESMLPYVRKEKPVMFEANSYKEILEALMFAKQLDLRAVILGGRDAWQCADLLTADNVPVIYEGVMQTPGELDAWDANYRAAGRLEAAGVKFCIAHRSADLAKQMPTEAGFAVAHGLSEEGAVRAVTLGAAEILGIDDRLGSLDAGKIADVIVTTGNPCQATTRVIHAFVRGKPVALASEHSRMAERFADRPAPEMPPLQRELRGSPSQTTR
ncbi:MAG: amidohydrolase family protein, partial [Phycisphaerae bacterium]